MINQQLIDHAKQQFQSGADKEVIKNTLISKGWSEKDVIEAINLADSKSVTENLAPLKETLKKRFFIVFSIILLISFIIGIYVYFKNNHFIKKTVSTSTPTTESTTTLSQTLERNPTKKVLSQEVYVSLNGETKSQNGGYTGVIKDGLDLNPIEDRKEYKKRSEQIKNDPNANSSLFLIEIRDIEDKTLLEIPVAVVHGTIGGDVPKYSYQDPGFFSDYILIPINTNSLVLRKRSGNILDRIYVEEWQPEVNILNYPKNVGSTDKFPVEIELQPLGKAFFYSLFLKNARDGSNMGMIGGSLQPKSGKITENVDLNNYPFTATDQWIIEAVGYSMFHQSKITVTEPITIALSSKNIEVKISGRDKLTRKSGESDSISWSHTFYGVDVTRGLKELCDKGRCFELIWTGNGVKFNEKYWELKPVGSVTTQIPSLRCEFRGSGKQSIHLQVKENGKVIGEDTYQYIVSGIGSEQTLCQINDY